MVAASLVVSMIHYPHVCRPNEDGLPGILDWAGRGIEGNDYPYDPTNYYFRRGQFVNDCCDILAMGQELDFPTAESERLAFSLQVKPLVRSENAEPERWIDYVHRFKEQINSDDFRSLFVRCLGVQEVMRNEAYKFTGTRDQRWLMIDGHEAILDTKCGSEPWYGRFQTAAYTMDGSGKLYRRYANLLKPNAPARLIPHLNNRDMDTFRIWARGWWLAVEHKGS